MYDQVAHVCLTYTTVWSGVPAFSEAHDLFIDKLNELKAQSITQQSVIRGTSHNVKDELDKTIALAIIGSKALSALALKIEDSELLARNLYSRTEWFRGNMLLRVARLTHLIEDLTAHATSLEDFGIESGFIPTLQAQVDSYKALTSAPRQAILHRKRATAALERLTKQIDGLLTGQMDLIMEILRTDTPEFAEDYFNARIVVDYKGKSRGSNPQNEEKEEGGDDE